MKLTHTDGKGDVSLGDATVVLGEDGLDDCPPVDATPSVAIDIKGAGFCASEKGSFDQVANAGFLIELEEGDGLTSQERFDYVLEGNGDGEEFDLVASNFVALDKDNNPIEDEAGNPSGVTIVPGTQSQNGYTGSLDIEEGVAYVAVAGSWKKKEGELSGNEDVTLKLTHTDGKGDVSLGDATVVLGEDGLDDCPPVDATPSVAIDIKGAGFCASEKGSFDQVANAGFLIELEEGDGLTSQERFDYVLEGNGDGEEFDLVASNFVAFDKDNNPIEDEAGDPSGVTIVPGTQSQNGYTGSLDIEEGVAYVAVAGSWKKKEGELSGNEDVTLKLTHTDGKGDVSLGDATVVLGEDGLDDCPPVDATPSVAIDIKGEGFCASEKGSFDQVANAGFLIELEEGDGLTSQERFDYVLEGNGDGEEFDLVASNFVAFDKDNNPIEDEAGNPSGVTIVPGTQSQNGYTGSLDIEEGVAYVAVAGSWKKKEGS